MPDADDTERAALLSALERLAGMPDAVRQAVADQQWAEIPLTVTEAAYAASLAAGVPLVAPAQTGGLERIDSVVVSVPVGATGVVQLGSVLIPVGAGLSVIAPVRLLLGTSDVRQLTLSGTAGAASLLLCGAQLPTFSVLAR